MKNHTTLCQPNAGRLKIFGDLFEQVYVGFFCQGDGSASNKILFFSPQFQLEGQDCVFWALTSAQK